MEIDKTSPAMKYIIKYDYNLSRKGKRNNIKKPKVTLDMVQRAFEMAKKQLDEEKNNGSTKEI